MFLKKGFSGLSAPVMKKIISFFSPDFESVFA